MTNWLRGKRVVSRLKKDTGTRKDNPEKKKTPTYAGVEEDKEGDNGSVLSQLTGKSNESEKLDLLMK